MGHKYWDCPFKKAIDALATAMDMRDEWGEVKFAAYYGAILQADPALAARVQGDWAARNMPNASRVVLSSKKYRR
jgi:hypothetical protein